MDEVRETIKLGLKDMALVLRPEDDDAFEVIIPDDDPVSIPATLFVAVAARFQHDQEWLQELYDWFTNMADEIEMQEVEEKVDE